MLDFLNNIIVASIIKSAIVIVALLTAFAYMTLDRAARAGKDAGTPGTEPHWSFRCFPAHRRWHKDGF